MAFNYKGYTQSAAVKAAQKERDKYKTYKESEAVTNAKEEWEKHSENKVSPWTGGSYGDLLKDTIDKINNREKFSYDLNGDMLFQQYKDQYMNQGKLAMLDTTGQAAAMTGGYGNSYAVTAGNQAYQGYLQQLNNIIPSLYELAMRRHEMEGNNLKDLYGIYNDQQQNEYGVHRDEVSDWKDENARLADAYYNEANMDWTKFDSNRGFAADVYADERNFDYGKYSDDRNQSFASYQQSVDEKQFAQQLAQQKAEHDAKMALNKEQFDKSYDLDKAQFEYSKKKSSVSKSSSSNGTKKGDTKKGDDGIDSILNMANEFYENTPGLVGVDTRTVDMYLNDKGISGEDAQKFKRYLVALGVPARSRS